MKSSSPVPSAGALVPGGHVVLCTQSKTYELRQVQTSNTVLVLRPQKAPLDDDGVSRKGVQAFATCSSTLEVLCMQATEKTKWPAQWLQELLPVWSGASSVAGPSLKSKAHYFAEVPYSDDDIEKAWTFMTAFEEDGHSFRPTERTLLELWQDLRRCVDVTGDIDVEQLFSDMRDTDYSRGLIQALINRISVSESLDRRIKLDRDTTLQWLAVNAIAAKTGSQEAQSWSESVPPEWLEDDADGQLSHCAAEAVEQAGAAPPEIAKAVAAAKTKEAAAGSKRIGKSTNWHEKLKRPKR